MRFRAAIKDPEELTYLFFAIGLGLAGGANQPVLAVVAFFIITLLLFIHKLATSREGFRQEDRMYVNITTDLSELGPITQLLTEVFPYVELKRLDTLDRGLDLSFICKAESMEQLDQVMKKVGALSENTQLSIVDQPDLIV